MTPTGRSLLTAALAAAFFAGCSGGGTKSTTGGSGATTTAGATGGGGTTSGGSAGGGSTGAACVALGNACSSASTCCGTSTVCAANQCQACGGLASPCCANQTCNGDFVCAQSGGQAGNCVEPTNADAGCVLSDAGGPCGTFLDCAGSNVTCNLPGDGGVGSCATFVNSASPACLANGQACPSTSSPTEPCCGYCDNGSCAARYACGVQGQSCAGPNDCCNTFQCVGAGSDGGNDFGDGGSDAGSAAGGTCQAVCQGQGGPCNPANGSTDCCTQQGVVCLALVGADSGPAGICDTITDSSSPPPNCVSNACSANECFLGSPCLVDETTGLDPCFGSGYVCDQQTTACRNPVEGENCLVGGASCYNAIPSSPYLAISSSTVSDLQCLPSPLGQAGSTYCLQPCNPSDPFQGTSDCLDRNTICKAVSGGGVCVQNAQLNGCGGTSKVLSSCTSEQPGDSVCMAYNQDNELVGFCIQGTLDGGLAGSACQESTNRQQGGFCNPGSFCVEGLCEPNCNAGTADAGATLACGASASCSPSFGEITDALDQGSCLSSCDFTLQADQVQILDAGVDGGPALAPGACGTSVEGASEKCIPETLYDGNDSASGFCVEEVSPALAIGEPCTEASVDPCVVGAYCLGFPTSNCLQLCDVGGNSGTLCPSGLTCEAIGLTSTEGSQFVGVCVPPQ